MTETVSVDLPAGEWIEIAHALPNVTAQLVVVGTARVFVGSAAPEGLAGPVIDSVGGLSLSEVDGNVYLCSIDIANVAWVLRG